VTEDTIRIPLNAGNSSKIQNDNITTYSPTSSTTSDDPSDPSYPFPVTPLSHVRAWDIEDELGLMRPQSDNLFTLIRNEMVRAGLLGNLDFRGVC
jgi:hypothetical protein